MGLTTLVLAVGGCHETSREPSGQPVNAFDTVGGIVVVDNGPHGAWGDAERWAVREDFRVGSLMAEDSIAFASELLTAGLAPSGDIYVLDFMASSALRLTGRGRFIERIGRPGPGPGELQNPSAIAWDSVGRTWVADGFRGRYTVFDANGEFKKTVPRPIHALARRQHTLHIEPDGTMIDERGRSGGAQFVRVDSTGAIGEELVSIGQPDAGFPRLVLRPSQKAIRFVLRNYRVWNRWALARDTALWVARTDDLTLYKLDLVTGDTLRVVRTVHRDDHILTETDEEAIRRGLHEVNVDRAEVELARPIVQSIRVLSDGYVLVQIVENVGVDGTAYDVFDPRGTFMGTLDMGFGIPTNSMPAFAGDTVLAVTLGEYEVPFLVRATIQNR